MDSQQRLFRQEAIDARRGDWLGTINVATPLSRWIWVVLGAGLATAIIAFIVFGHYTKRQHVTGQLVPSMGLLGVTAVNAGTVAHVFVHAGDNVRTGDRLLEISGELDSASLGSTREEISAQLRAERDRLEHSLTTQARRNDVQARTLKAALGLLLAQERQIDAQWALQARQASAAETLLERIKPLRAKRYVSAVQVQQQLAVALNAKAQLKELERQRLQNRREIATTHQQMAQLPLDLATQRDVTAGKISTIDQQLAENEVQRAVVLRAPRAGVVSTLLAKLGQHVVAGQALLTILPQGDRLLAQLMVPSRAVGFIAPGSRVVLRYEAYPYQKFGQQYGRVASISRSALNPAEVTALTGQLTAQPLYRIKVRLDHQSIAAYGRAQPLKPGMALSADILMERRSLLEWVFEPLYGLRGAVAAEEGNAHG